MVRTGLTSVLQQTYRNLEIIIQDDSSNDECQKVIESMADPRILYIRNTPSLGTLRNLRAGYLRCTGTYICTLNDDDVYAPTYIEQMVTALENNPSCCLAFSDHFIINERGDTDLGATDINSRNFGRDKLSAGIYTSTLKMALLNKSIPGMFAVYRRSIMDFSDFPDEVDAGYDFWLTYLAVRSGLPICYNPERLTYYRVHADSQTSSFADPQRRIRSLTYDLYIHQRFYGDSRLQEIHPAISEHIAKVHMLTGTTRLRMRQRRAAFKEFRLALDVKISPAPLVGIFLAMLPASLAVYALNLQSKSPKQLA